MFVCACIDALCVCTLCVCVCVCATMCVIVCDTVIIGCLLKRWTDRKREGRGDRAGVVGL